MHQATLKLRSEKDSEKLGKTIASLWQDNQTLTIFLLGDLGAGKTTLARGFIRHFGFNKVPSPTYSIVQSYQKNKYSIHHLDCYRLGDGEELETIGIRDYQQANSAFIVEWASLATDYLPKPDLTIRLTVTNKYHLAKISSHSNQGKHIKLCLTDVFS